MERVVAGAVVAVVNAQRFPRGWGNRASDFLRAWLRERGDEPGPLFCPVGQTGEIRLTRMRGESISYIRRRRQETAGIEHFSPHDLPRSCISQMLENGVDVFTVQKLAGHADASTTARYDRRGETAKPPIAERLTDKLRAP